MLAADPPGTMTAGAMAVHDAGDIIGPRGDLGGGFGSEGEESGQQQAFHA